MKYYILTFCLTILILESVIAQFQECNSPTTKVLHDVNFINENIGVAVGDSGTIIRTIDGGLNWNIVMVNDSVSFKKVKFFNSLNGISIGSDIYITENGGTSWTKSDNSNYEFYDVEILNDSTCLVSGIPNRIIKSTNYGYDWEIIVSDTSDYKIRFLSFLNEEIGYASHWVGSVIESTLKTQDGGETWIEIEDESGGHITLIEDISFISDDIGFRGGWYSPHLMITQNSSEYWEDVNLPDSTTISGFGIYDFHIENSLPNAFYACGWYGDIFKSTDGGNNWIELNSGLSNTTTLYGIFFINDTIGWAVGQNGTIVRTSNGGVAVGLLDVEENLKLCLFPNPTRDIVHIGKQEAFKIEEVRLYDLNGRKLMSENNKETINLCPFSDGIYIIEIKTDIGISRRKILKK